MAVFGVVVQHTAPLLESHRAELTDAESDIRKREPLDTAQRSSRRTPTAGPDGPERDSVGYRKCAGKC